MSLYIGLMSGTSFDGIDAVLADFEPRMQVHAHYHLPYTDSVRAQLLQLSQPKQAYPLESLFDLHHELATLNARAVLALLAQTGLSPEAIQAIGLHGQTLRHYPQATPAWTLQLGDPVGVSLLTGIRTVAQFRNKDLWLGGQGAPLAPILHAQFQAPTENRIIANIGGIANISVIPHAGAVFGFDTGPGNLWLDALAQHYLQQPFDRDGHWASTGVIITSLLTELLQHPFFNKPFPKSTGRDEFTLTYFATQAQPFARTPEDGKDLAATAVELTAVSLVNAIRQTGFSAAPLFLCGGGAYNRFLLSRIQTHLPDTVVSTTATLGVEPSAIEPLLMAYLAYKHVQNEALDLGAITGSQRPHVLGTSYFPS